MVGKGYYIDRLIELNSYEREGKSMQDKLFTTKTGCLTLYRCQWWVRLSQQLNSMFKSIYKAISQSGLFRFIPRSRLFKLSGSFLADLKVQNQLLNLVRALAKTSSTSRSLAVPASISLILRHISISQALATCSSFGPSRLATNALANFALSLSDRALAAFFSASKSAVLILGSNTVVMSRIMHQTIAHNKALNPTLESSQLLPKHLGGAGQLSLLITGHLRRIFSLAVLAHPYATRHLHILCGRFPPPAFAG